MLSTRPLPNKVRRADNAFPRPDGSLATRPGAQQLVTGPVDHVAPWGDRLVFERAGRIVLWDGTEHDLRPAGRTLHGVAYQALTGDGVRENRFYLADGVRPLSYLVREGDAYVQHDVVNTVLQDDGTPYPIDIPVVLANWRGRLWLASAGSNRIRHCELEAPADWDPLWFLEFQTGSTDAVTALLPAGDRLLVGLRTSLWAVAGYSQYDWEWGALTSSMGCVGPHALVGDASLAMTLSDLGVFRAGGDAPLSADVRDLWEAQVSGQLAWDARRRLVLAWINGRVLVLGQDSGAWGELAADARGVWAGATRCGWYGGDGIWTLGLEDTPDVRVDGTVTPVATTIEGWPVQSNRRGNARALLNRGWLILRGSPGGVATYTPVVDGVAGPAHVLSLYDGTAPTWNEAATATPLAWPAPEVLREVVPRLAGRTLLHRLEATGHLELVSWDFEVRFGLPKKTAVI